MPIMRLREAVYSGLEDRLCIVPFTDLKQNPKLMLEKIHDFLQIPHFNYDFNNVELSVYEQDMHHGFKPHSLHSIKEGSINPDITKDTSIFDMNFMNSIHSDRYKDITEFIFNNTEIKN
jgi:hypothetical protein